TYIVGYCIFADPRVAENVLETQGIRQRYRRRICYVQTLPDIGQRSSVEYLPDTKLVLLRDGALQVRDVIRSGQGCEPRLPGYDVADAVDAINVADAIEQWEHGSNAVSHGHGIDAVENGARAMSVRLLILSDEIIVKRIEGCEQEAQPGSLIMLVVQIHAVV